MTRKNISTICYSEVELQLLRVAIISGDLPIHDLTKDLVASDKRLLYQPMSIEFNIRSRFSQASYYSGSLPSKWGIGVFLFTLKVGG